MLHVQLLCLHDGDKSIGSRNIIVDRAMRNYLSLHIPNEFTEVLLSVVLIYSGHDCWWVSTVGPQINNVAMWISTTLSEQTFHDR